MKGCRPLTQEEVALTLQSFQGPYARRDQALFLLGVKLGFRISELLSLRLGDVIQDGRLVDQVTVPCRHMKKKTEGCCTVLLHPEAREVLSAWIEELHAAGYLTDDAFIFQSRKGRNRPISRVQAWHVLAKAYQSNRLTGKLGTHSMRKTFTNHLYDRLDHDPGQQDRQWAWESIRDPMKGCRPLTPEEVTLTLQSFQGAYAQRDRALFLLGVKSGFRISELLSLRLADVLQAGRLVDRVTVSRHHTKKTKGRTVLLHPEARADILAWIEELKAAGYLTDDAFVFQSRKGRNQPISRAQAWRVLQTAYQSNRLTGKLGTHSMRKTFVNHSYDWLDHDPESNSELAPDPIRGQALIKTQNETFTFLDQALPMEKPDSRYPGQQDRQWAWASMRILRTFTAFQVAATAEITLDDASKFIRVIARAGYLRRLNGNSGRAGYTVWQLVRNTGPDAPICRKDGRVYDPNLDQVFASAAQENHPE